MPALSFGTFGAASCVPHAIFNYFLDSAVTAIILGWPHGEIGGGYRHLTDVSSLSPATGWYSSFALLMRYSNSRPLWKSCFSLPRRRRLDRSNVDNLTDVEFVRGWQPRFGRPARSSWHDAATRRVAPPDLSLKLPGLVGPASYWTLAFNFSSGPRPRTDCATYSAVFARSRRARIARSSCAGRRKAIANGDISETHGIPLVVALPIARLSHFREPGTCSVSRKGLIECRPLSAHPTADQTYGGDDGD
jgi:hypothetical protein